jgi:hypothetical protein
LTERTDLTDEERATASESDLFREASIFEGRQESGLDCFNYKKEQIDAPQIEVEGCSIT